MSECLLAAFFLKCDDVPLKACVPARVLDLRRYMAGLVKAREERGESKQPKGEERGVHPHPLSPTTSTFTSQSLAKN